MFSRNKPNLSVHSLIMGGSLIAITLIFFWRIAFTGMILARGDVYNYFYPLWDARNAAFRAGHIPLWSPDIFMGVPLLSNSQIGTFYPPNWLVMPFDAPTGITISLLAHTIWAMLGMVLLTRRALHLDRMPAILSGVLFGLGGYLGGQSEHINQLQALSWMPWLFWHISQQRLALLDTELRWPISIRFSFSFAICIALQLLAGHPQTVFITLVGLAVIGLTNAFVLRHPDQAAIRMPFTLNMVYLTRVVLVMICGGVLGLLLAAPQLIPTLELSQIGNRGGGLDPQKVLAFSFNPLLLGRGLLPSYDGLLFGEYIAYSGVIGLGLAIIGLFARHTSIPHNKLPFVLLVIIGFLFALGAYNPLNWLLAALPGFSFFRVPARWMALEALGVAALAGIGLQSLQVEQPRKRVLTLVLIVTIVLALASILAGRQAVDVIGPAVPTLRSWIGWTLALLVLIILIWTRYQLGAKRVVVLIASAAIIELFFASQIMPFNLTAPHDVYSASRFTIRQLQVYGAEQTPPGRLLSISPLEFDPGDKDALNARYAALGMDALSTRIALVATKLREIIGPNLGMKWGIPSIDGFDGGLLPTRYYSAFSHLLLPEGSEPSTDGRLREMLARPACNSACIPDQRWLNLTNTRYMLTDKTADVVQDSVFYDTSFTLILKPDQSIIIDTVPAFEANAIDLLCRDTVACLADVRFTYADGSTEQLTRSKTFTVETYSAARYKLTTLRIPVTIQIIAQDAINLSAVTLIDTRVQVFQQLALPPWERVLSSDIKLYENTTVQPRAFLVGNSIPADADAGTSLILMHDPSFDPTQTAVVVDGKEMNTPSHHGTATITTYTAERVEIQVQTDTPAYLILTDAYYPGWQATVNSIPTHILRANLMFRAVEVPVGESQIVFEYRPWWWPLVVIGGGLGWLGVGFLAWLRHSSH